MKQSVRLGRVAGIPVGAHWTVAVILAIVTDILAADVLPATVPHHQPIAYWTTAAIGAMVFAASLLAHELAHAIVARRNGMTVRSITLWMLGGMTELDGDPPDAGADLRIALAGPATSLAAAVLLGGVALAVGRGGGPEVTAAAAAWLAVMNAVLAVFNLLPGAPLDGGRVLRAVLWRIYRDRTRAATTAARAGWYLGLVLAAGGVFELIGWRDLGGLWLMLIGWFLATAARSEQTVVTAGSLFAGVRVADVMTPHPDIVPGWSTVQHFMDHVAGYSRQSSFPVVGFDGELTGVVVTRLLARIRPADRAALRISRVALPVPPAYLARPDDPAGPLFARPLLAGDLAAVVVDEGRVVGIVTAADIGQAARRRRPPAPDQAWRGQVVEHG